MRIVSYNILDGGEGRADPLAEVIESQRPDIVALIEADDAAVLERIGKRLKMDVAFGQGKRHGVAILSHWPIAESINHSLLREGLTDALLEATVIDPAGSRWTVGAVHLHAHAAESDEAIRLREVEIILEIFGTRAHLLAGDFNANSPMQQIDPQQCKPSTRKEWEANGRKIPRQAVQKLLDAGYIDSLAEVNGHAAQKFGSFSTQYPGQRVDYIFAHGIEAGRIKAAGIEQDRLAKYASDHFPVFAVIE